jgi:predicted glycoside hydrolase/deacetylase ChbG (UPF0249 family)
MLKRATGRRMALAGLSVALGLGGRPVTAQVPAKNIAERLGYPADSKLLILHADDLAVAHSVDQASFAALESGAVSSASVMVPCPWLTEVADWFQRHPDADLGLHLTLTSEWKTYRWGPVAPLDQVPTLIDPHGYFWPDVGPVAQRATAADVERELRAQVERAVSVGIHPTHLDTHMGTLLARPDYYAALVKVAHDYHLPFLAARPPLMPAKLAALLGPNDVVLDSVIIFSPGVPPDRWTETYVERLKALKPGLNEMIVHLGHDDSELEAITVGHPDYGAAWRERDFKAVNSPEFRQALTDNHIILVHWKQIKALL